MTSSPNWSNQTIWTGDNLPVMRGMNSESVDLIYLDPPFNSKANYAAPIGSKAAGAEFKDTWSLSDVDAEWINLIESKHPTLHRVLLAAMTDSDKSYLAYMAARLLEMKRLLKPAGSIYLHCDPTMSHYLKLVMDAIFGKSAFTNEVVWKRTGSHGGAKRWGPIHDTILFYAGSDKVWNLCYQPYDPEYLDKYYRLEDERGRYRIVSLTGAGTRTGESGLPWRDIDPTDSGRHWAVPRKSLQLAYPNRTDLDSIPVQKRLDMLDDAGRIHWPPRGKSPGQKRYINENPGTLIQDIVTDIRPLSHAAKERTGYPTQKPLALLRRIVEASSNPGDVVLDPFCGCATALIAAEELQRQWIGIDISDKAAELVQLRMRDELGMFYGGAHRTDVPKRTDLGALPPYRSHKPTLYGLQEGNCAGCAAHFEARHLEVDHIIARSNGGTDHVGNLQLLCGSCNRIKGDRGMEYLRVKLQL